MHLQPPSPVFFSKLSKRTPLKKIFFLLFAINLVVLGGYFYQNTFSSQAIQNRNFKNILGKLSDCCWISYAPSNFDPGKDKYPTRKEIRADLSLLKNIGFDGLVTFGSDKSLRFIPEVAKKLGFVGVIMGLWDPNSSEEINNAIAAYEYVDGYCVGHMGLNKNYDFRSLKNTVQQVKSATDKPVTTSEGFELYQRGSELYRLGDWVFPDASLFWHSADNRNPEVLANVLMENYLKLTAQSEKPVLMKTVGYPSSGQLETTLESQRLFFQHLLDNSLYFPYERIRFTYFEAFDQPWKKWHTVEAHWGLFNSDKSPKPASELIWGKALPLRERNHFRNKKPSFNYRFLFLALMCNVAALLSVLFLYSLHVRKNTEKLILTVHNHSLMIQRKGEARSIRFAKTHDKCFSMLVILLRHSKPLFCGELIHLTQDSGLIQNCNYTTENRCLEKKQFCKPYRALNNHRIGTIRKALQEFGLGDIRVIPGKSEWVLVINENIRIEVQA